MGDIQTILQAQPPRTLKEAFENWPAHWPTRAPYHLSPPDWRDQVFYFLLPDRFSNGQERADRLLDCDLSTPQGLQRIHALRGPGWQWSNWQASGGQRFQGGTLAGIQSKLPYLQKLGVTTLWIGPVFRQRVEENTYHGYGIQDFLDVDPRFGSRQDLVNLVDAAHQARPQMYVVLDVIFNHSGCNWLYDLATGNAFEPPYLAQGSYHPIWPRDKSGQAVTGPAPTFGTGDYVQPGELQGENHYLRAGKGDLGAGDIRKDDAEHKRTGFCCLRKFNLSDETLTALALAYHYWIALTDIDGFRIDTFKHVTREQARNFCNAIKEYAEDLGKDDFFLVAEIAGGDQAQTCYLETGGRNLNACLDIGNQRETICNVGKGLTRPGSFFYGYSFDEDMGSHRNWGSRHLSVSNDHDHVFGAKLRLAAGASNDHQGAAVAALQLLTLGIPCLYYGTEQGLASGAEADQQRWLKNWGGDDALLREAMFGPEHPRPLGWTENQPASDPSAVGFGPHGTAGWHVFNQNHPTYTRIATLADIRGRFKPLRRGRQYERQISYLSYPFHYPDAGQLLAWSRLFDDQEMLVVVNGHGVERRGARVAVDARLSTDGMWIVANTDPTAPVGMRVGDRLDVASWDDRRFVALDQWLLGPSEVMVLANYNALDAARRSGQWPLA